MLNFIFGKRGLASTPQELAERREMERAIHARSAGRVPQDPWEGLNSIAQAIGSRVEDSRLDEAETKGRAGADEKFRSLFKTSTPTGATAATQATVTPTAYSPEEQTGSPGLPGIAKAWLNTIAGPESAGAYDTLYGGTKFADFSDHPGANIPITSGPNKGKTSSAAGKYQFLAPTWEEQQAKLKLPDFSPASQDAAAWNLAQETYKAKTGKDLGQALESADDAGIVEIARLLSGTWTSLPGGIEQGIDDQGFVSKYRQNLQGGQGQPAMARQPVQMAQNGSGFDPALVDAYSDPWMSEGQRDVLKLYIQQQLQNADPRTKLELRKMGLEIEALENPTPEYGFTVLPDGRMIRTDKAKGTAEPIMTSEPKPTSDMQNYDAYAADERKAGRQPLGRLEFEQAVKKAGATSINMNTGEPGDSKLRGKLQEKEAESWAGFQSGAAIASGLTQQIEVLDELGKMAPQGGLQGRLAQAFPGFSTAGDAFMSIATRIAPSFREPGSGSTSDIEYQGFLNGLPRLQTSPGGNLIISQTIRNMAQIKMERGLIVDRYSNGEITAPEARRQMAELNKRSIMTPELQAVINANTDKPAAGTPDVDGWVTMPDGTQVREKK